MRRFALTVDSWQLAIGGHGHRSMYTIITGKSKRNQSWQLTADHERLCEYECVVCCFGYEQRGLRTKRPTIIFFFFVPTKPIRQIRTGNKVLVRRRERTCRIQTLPWVAGGRRGKDDRKKIHWSLWVWKKPFWYYVQGFIFWHIMDKQKQTYSL